MFRSQSSDHHQGSITVLVQLLLIDLHVSLYSGMWLYVVCASVHTIYLYHTERYIVCTDAQTTYSHIPEYNEACMPISSNCTSTVIDP